MEQMDYWLVVMAMPSSFYAGSDGFADEDNGLRYRSLEWYRFHL